MPVLMKISLDNLLLEAAMLIQHADKVVVLSGAGLSSASGLPTYRNQDGLWNEAENRKYSDVSSYEENPTRFLNYWKQTARLMLEARPNSAHYALAQLQKIKPNTVLITQNVDGLLQKAGCTDVIELHGNIRRQICVECGLTSDYPLGRCVRCGSEMRPDVVFFGEMLDKQLFAKAQLAAAHASVLLVVGTTAEVYPAAAIPLYALANNAKILVIDILATKLSEVACLEIIGKAELLLPLLLKKLLP